MVAILAMKSKFRDVKISPNWDGTFVLAKSLAYTLVSKPLVSVLFRIGLIWNGGSVPWIAAWLIPRFGEYDWPFFIHDLGYGCRLRPRKDWDIELLALCKVVDLELLSKMGWFRRSIMGSVYLTRRHSIYRAVRLAGGSHFTPVV